MIQRNNNQNRENAFPRVMARALSLALAGLCTLAFGCGTTTQRLATEQLLISDAVDQAISQIDFDSLRYKKVFLDTTYLQPIKGVGFVNAEYIISSLRQQLTASRCLIQEDRETADIIVEPRVGALGTNGHEVTYGIPQNSAISTAAAAFSSSPIPSVPEISFGRSDAQSGIAKIIVFAFDKETKQPVWQSGIARAESNSNNTWVLGAGPFQKGSVHDNVRFAGTKIKKPPMAAPFHHANDETQPEFIDLNIDEPHVFARPEKNPKAKESTVVEKTEDSEVQPASYEEEASRQ